jgi:hypothetical protein
MIQIEPYGKAHFMGRIRKLFNLNTIRINEISETIQYTVLYGIATFYVGTWANAAFPSFDKTKSAWELMLEVLGQTIVLAICVFYIRKLVKTIPFLFYLPGKHAYNPYLSTEFHGEIVISIIFITLQINLIKKLEELSKRIVGEH